jgi:hypothetical protein
MSLRLGGKTLQDTRNFGGQPRPLSPVGQELHFQLYRESNHKLKRKGDELCKKVDLILKNGIVMTMDKDLHQYTGPAPWRVSGDSYRGGWL